jgi:hypothetical protein
VVEPQSVENAHRAPLARFAYRAAVLATLGIGLWLAGQATAFAEESMIPPTAVGAPFAAVDAVASPGVEVLATAASALAPPGESADPLGTPAAAGGPVAAAPVAVTAATVVSVADLAVPLPQAAEPVIAMTAPLSDVVRPVVAAIGQAVPPVVVDLSPLEALDAALPPVADALHALLGACLADAQQRPDTDFGGLGEVVEGSAAGPTGASRVMVRADKDDDLSTGTGGAAGGPVPPVAPASGGPAQACYGGTHTFDQSTADLPAAVRATSMAALVAAGEARDAAGNIAFDPSFSPD